MSTKTWDSLVEVLGEETALKFIDRYAGRRIYIHKRLKETHEWVKILGMEKALALSLHTGGFYLEVPALADQKRQERNKAIRRAIEGNTPIGEVARRFEITERTAKKIAAARCKLGEDFHGGTDTLPLADG